MRFFVLIILTCSLLFSWCGLTYADLSGSLEWDYGEYHADEDGAQSFDSSYFAQRYSLLFSHRGTIMGGRGGDYDIALGGEWLGLNNDINNNGVNTEDKLSTSKLLYLGELNFAPGGLPFSLTMYSRDMSPSSMRKARYFLGTFDNVVLGLPRQTVLTPQPRLILMTPMSSHSQPPTRLSRMAPRCVGRNQMVAPPALQAHTSCLSMGIRQCSSSAAQKAW